MFAQRVKSTASVFVSDGFGETYYVNSAEIYNPSTGTWTRTGKKTTTRRLPAASILTYEMVLIAGKHSERFCKGCRIISLIDRYLGEVNTQYLYW